MAEKKPLFLIQMCESYEEELTRYHFERFSTSVVEVHPWLSIQHKLPAGLVARIKQKLTDVCRAQCGIEKDQLDLHGEWLCGGRSGPIISKVSAEGRLDMSMYGRPTASEDSRQEIHSKPSQPRRPSRLLITLNFKPTFEQTSSPQRRSPTLSERKV
jgi:hypothetical protein